MVNGVRGAILTNPKRQHKGKASSCGLQHEFNVYQLLCRDPNVGILTAISKHFLINPIDLEEEADYLSDTDDEML